MICVTANLESIPDEEIVPLSIILPHLRYLITSGRDCDALLNQVPCLGRTIQLQTVCYPQIKVLEYSDKIFILKIFYVDFQCWGLRMLNYGHQGARALPTTILPGSAERQTSSCPAHICKMPLLLVFI